MNCGQSVIEFWILTAQCFHELEETQKAKDTLLAAPKDFQQTALHCYHLACYETQLGNIGSAKQLLGICLVKDKKYRQNAIDDLKLQPLWDSFDGQ